MDMDCTPAVLISALTPLQVIGLLLSEITRSLLFSMCFFVNVRTGARARAMVLAMVYNKVTKLRNVGDKSIGEVCYRIPPYSRMYFN